MASSPPDHPFSLLLYSTSQPTFTIAARLSRPALRAIIGSVSLVWLMHYKSSPGLAYPPTALTVSHLHVAATCPVHAESLRKGTSGHPQTAGTLGENREENLTDRKAERHRQGIRQTFIRKKNHGDFSRWVCVWMEIRIERVLVSTFLIRALATTEHAEVFLSLSNLRRVYIAQLKNVHIFSLI